MYVPRHFSMTDEQIRGLLSEVGAGDLVTTSDEGMVATYLPLLYDPRPGGHGSLLGHVTRNNTQWRHSAPECLVIMHGPDHYISPTWFDSAEDVPQVVPTWNYVTVHAYGQLIAHDDPEWTLDVVRRLSAHHESSYSLDDVPADLVTRMLRAIVGIEIRISRLEAKAKMSQNKMPHDVSGIIEGLRGAGADEVADWMAEYSLPAAERRSDLIDDIARRHRSGTAAG